MTVPPEHLTYLRQKGYSPRCRDAFTDEETAILVRYGHWMQALAAGEITPATPEQKHFLQVARGEAEPQTLFERVWRKLSSQQTVSELSQSSSQPHPADQAPDLKEDHTETLTKLEELGEMSRYVEKVRAQMEAERAEVLQTVQERLKAIEAKYAQQLQEASQALAELETEVKAEILNTGKSVRIGAVHAIFYRGYVTWDSKGLAQYAQTNPEVQLFRKVGAPRVAIRYATAK